MNVAQTCLNARRKSSLTVNNTTCVSVLSTCGNVKSFFTKLLSWLLFLNLATTIMSVNPPISYTAHTFAVGANENHCSSSAYDPLGSIATSARVFLIYGIFLRCPFTVSFNSSTVSTLNFTSMSYAASRTYAPLDHCRYKNFYQPEKSLWYRLGVI